MLRGVQFEFMAAAHSGTQGDNGEVLHFEAVFGLVHAILHLERDVRQKVEGLQDQLDQNSKVKLLALAPDRGARCRQR